jgi:hypothetical protein
MEKHFQFTTSQILTATAFCGIALGGSTGAWRYIESHLANTPWRLFWIMQETSPFWVPIAAFAFAAGYRKITIRMTVVFAIIEAIAYVAMIWFFP